MSTHQPWYKILYVQVLIAIVLGVLLGWLAPDDSHQPVDQLSRPRLRQADQDGDRADHLLHDRLRHRAYPGGQERRTRRPESAGLFRSRLQPRSADRHRRRHALAAGRGLFGGGHRRPGRPGEMLRRDRRQAEPGRLHPAYHSRQRRRRVRLLARSRRVRPRPADLPDRRHPAGAVLRRAVRLRADAVGRTRPCLARTDRRHGAGDVRRHRHHHESRAARRVRRHGLHDRQIRPLRARQSLESAADVLCHLGAVRADRTRRHRPHRRLLDPQLPAFHQGRIADRARHVLLGKRAAAR